MKPFRWIVLILVLVLATVAACGRIAGPGTSSLPTSPIHITPAPSAEAALRSYLDAMLVEDYPTMYGMLAQASQAAISQKDFASRYTDALNAMSVSKMEYGVRSLLTNPQSAQIAFNLTYHTVLFGDIQRDMNANMVLENGDWRIQWDDSLILPELAGGKHLVANHTSPARGDIYDRNGNAIATQADIDSIGLVSGAVSGDTSSALYNLIGRLTGVSPLTIRTSYENYANPGLYIPVGEASVDDVNKSGIANFAGVQLNPYNSRFYKPNVAPHAVGYTLFISQDNINSYRRQGYSGAERVGVEGIEKWGESYLHGRDAATLYVAAKDGTLETALAQVDSQPADSIYLTIDGDLQAQAQAAMDGLPGAIVVMEMSTGRVLAMVSSPAYDPNLYDTANYNRRWSLDSMLNDPAQPTFNRASQGQYPLGSVFKTITMATALDSGVFTADSTWDCQYTYTELVSSGGPTLYDWTWADCQKWKTDHNTDTCPPWPPSGMLTLPQGLMRSCDPWFYHIGYTLWSQQKGNLISDMARAFGLGKATGIGQVAEAEGFIPAAPTDGTDATSIAIGQGKIQVTPLQVAAFIAAIGNGGTLYRPQLVDKIQPVTGDPIDVFKPQANGTLPISQENLALIQNAMRSVVEDPKGTAYSRFVGFSIPVAAKTGTAESGSTDPHAWFAGYSMENNPDKPDIAVAVLVNNGGEGAIWAAPVFRRVMEIYFNGHGQTVYPWESTFGVINPDYGAPQPTPTPTP
ncbi:MAG TPA: penicillin-binding transpeptidase domain-containing protein [Anaerolineales bacterium]|nr:penicillin-binding transpeptidase domain-containing protein [Anaerolineales bacterium]